MTLHFYALLIVITSLPLTIPNIFLLIYFCLLLLTVFSSFIHIYLSPLIPSFSLSSFLPFHILLYSTSFLLLPLSQPPSLFAQPRFTLLHLTTPSAPSFLLFHSPSSFPPLPSSNLFFSPASVAVRSVPSGSF